MDEEFEIFVTHVDKVGPFIKICAQRNLNRTSIIDDTIKQFLTHFNSGHGVVDPLTLVLDQLVVSKYNDDIYYRAQVVNLSEVQYGIIGVKFIDFGNTEKISAKSIRTLKAFENTAITHTPPLAFEFMLAGIIPQTRKNEILEFNDATISKVRQMLCHEVVGFKVECRFESITLASVTTNQGGLLSRLINAGLGIGIPIDNQCGTLKTYYDLKMKNRPPPGFDFPPPPLPTQPSQPVQPLSHAMHQIFTASSSVPTQEAHVQTPSSKTVPPSISPTPYYSTALTVNSNSSLKVNSTHSVSVSCVDDGPLAFSVQLNANSGALSNLMSGLNMINLQSIRSVPIPGTVCIGKFKPNGINCRAAVMEVYDDSCKLYYYDYGTVEQLPLTEIYELPQKFARAKAFAMKVTLKGSEMFPKRSKMVNDNFIKLVTDKTLTMKVTANEGLSMKQCCELFDGTDNLLDKMKEMLYSSFKYKHLEISLSSEHHVVVSFVNNIGKLPWNFCIQLESSLSDLEGLMLEVSKYCSQTAASPLPNIPGLPVFAMYCEDMIWYRAELVSLHEKKAHVLFVDFGNSEDVPISYIRFPSKELIDALPAQAVYCRLQSADTLENAAESFYSMTSSKSFVMTVVSKLKDTEELLVRLTDKTTLPYTLLHMQLIMASQPIIPAATCIPSVMPTQCQPLPALMSLPVQNQGWKQQASITIDKPGVPGVAVEIEALPFVRRKESVLNEQVKISESSNNGKVSWATKDGSFEPRCVSSKSDTCAYKLRSEAYGSRGNEKIWEKKHGNPELGKNWRSEKPIPGSREDDQNFSSSRLRSDENKTENNCVSRDTISKKSEAGTKYPNKFLDQTPSYDANSDSEVRDSEAIPPKSTLQFQPLILSVGSTLDALVVFMLDPNNFYMQPMATSDQLETLMNAIATKCEAEGLFPASLATGEPCLAKFSQDGGWYRAKVSNVTGDNVFVEFVDYGNSDTVDKVTSIRQITKDFMELPIQSFLCNLRGACSSATTWSEEEINLFDETTTEKSLQVEIVAVNNGKFSVVIREGETCVNEKFGATPNLLAPRSKLPELSFEMNCPQEATVSWFTNPSNFWLQLSSNASKLDELHTVINGLEISNLLVEVKEGLFVLALYPDDGSYYRAKVLATRESKARVLYVDYGQIKVLEAREIHSMPEMLMDIPAFGLPCSLAGVLPISGDWPKPDTTEADNIFKSSNYVCTFLKKLHEGKYHVSLKNPDGIDIVDLLVEEGHAILEAHCEAEPMVSPAEEDSGELSPGLSCAVYVSYIENISSFYVQRVVANNALEELQENLQAACLEEADEYPGGIHLCAAKYSEDGQWYRALPLCEPTDAIIPVRFVDYGNCDASSELKKLPEEFLETPPFATFCSLSVKPTADMGCIWSEEASSKFETLAMESNVVAKVLLKTNKGLIVDLLSDSVSVVKLMVDENLAVSSIKDVHVSFVFSHSEFCIQLVEDGEKILDLQDRLSQEDFEDVIEVTEGLDCIAKFLEDECWYRANVSSVGPDSTTVTFIDFGNSSEAVEFKALPKDLDVESLPPFAKKCTLKATPTNEAAVLKIMELAVINFTVLKAEIPESDVSPLPVSLFLDGKDLLEDEEVSAQVELDEISGKELLVDEEVSAQAEFDEISLDLQEEEAGGSASLIDSDDVILSKSGILHIKEMVSDVYENNFDQSLENEPQTFKPQKNAEDQLSQNSAHSDVSKCVLPLNGEMCNKDKGAPSERIIEQIEMIVEETTTILEQIGVVTEETTTAAVVTKDQLNKNETQSISLVKFLDSRLEITRNIHDEISMETCDTSQVSTNSNKIDVNIEEKVTSKNHEGFSVKTNELVFNVSDENSLIHDRVETFACDDRQINSGQLSPEDAPLPLSQTSEDLNISDFANCPVEYYGMGPRSVSEQNNGKEETSPTSSFVKSQDISTKSPVQVHESIFVLDTSEIENRNFRESCSLDVEIVVSPTNDASSPFMNPDKCRLDLAPDLALDEDAPKVISYGLSVYESVTATTSQYPEDTNSHCSIVPLLTERDAKKFEEAFNNTGSEIPEETTSNLEKRAELIISTRNEDFLNDAFELHSNNVPDSPSEILPCQQSTLSSTVFDDVETFQSESEGAKEFQDYKVSDSNGISVSNDSPVEPRGTDSWSTPASETNKSTTAVHCISSESVTFKLKKPVLEQSKQRIFSDSEDSPNVYHSADEASFKSPSSVFYTPSATNASKIKTGVASRDRGMEPKTSTKQQHLFSGLTSPPSPIPKQVCKVPLMEKLLATKMWDLNDPEDSSVMHNPSKIYESTAEKLNKTKDNSTPVESNIELQETPRTHMVTPKSNASSRNPLEDESG